MTNDFIEDLDEACVKEGYKFFIAITKDGEGYIIRHSINELPKQVFRKKGEESISRTEDFLDAAKVALVAQEND